MEQLLDEAIAGTRPPIEELLQTTLRAASRRVEELERAVEFAARALHLAGEHVLRHPEAVGEVAQQTRAIALERSALQLGAAARRSLSVSVSVPVALTLPVASVAALIAFSEAAGGEPTQLLKGLQIARVQQLEQVDVLLEQQSRARLEQPRRLALRWQLRLQRA